jgi:hypothetical protein
MSAAERVIIGQAVDAFVTAIKRNNDDDAADAAKRLAGGALRDLNRIADALEKIAHFETEPEAEG